MTTSRPSTFFHDTLATDETAAGFEHLALLLDDATGDGTVWIRVVGKELDDYEVIVKAGHGYQLLRFGWPWIPANVSPRPSELSKPKWQLVGDTQPSIAGAEALASSNPIIGGPIEVSKGAEIRRS